MPARTYTAIQSAGTKEGQRIVAVVIAIFILIVIIVIASIVAIRTRSGQER